MHVHYVYMYSTTGTRKYQSTILYLHTYTRVCGYWKEYVVYICMTASKPKFEFVDVVMECNVSGLVYFTV